MGLHEPAYLKLDDKTFLSRIRQAQEILRSCELCPRQCRVNRLNGELGFCSAGPAAEVAHAQLHFGEEPVLSDHGGAGTIFFSHCALKCVYCQNYQISRQSGISYEKTNAELARIMRQLQEQGAQNIDLVSPTHYVPMILEAVYLARQQGLNIPLVYNTNGYEREEILALLDGIIDIYLPDIKYSEEKNAWEYSQAPGYWPAVQKAIARMYAQTGDLARDESNRAWRGLLVRHLVLPERVAGSFKVLEFLKKTISLNIGLSVMSQYAPCYQAKDFPQLNRAISPNEYAEVVARVEELGFQQCWIQELNSNEVYFPDFERPDVFDDQDQTIERGGIGGD